MSKIITRKILEEIKQFFFSFYLKGQTMTRSFDKMDVSHLLADTL